MRLIIIGCEYTGATTLARNVQAWLRDDFGEPAAMIHDHFMPRIGEGRKGITDHDITPDEEQTELMKLEPWALEMFMRYMIHYHLGHHFYADNDHICVNWYYGDAVYAPMYFGYGGPGMYADRRVMARGHDNHVNDMAPDTVLVHLTASPEKIRERMSAEPRPISPFRDEDIEHVLDRFAEEASHGLFRRKISLDTTNSTPEETLAEFKRKIESHLTDRDRMRLLAHKALTA